MATDEQTTDEPESTEDQFWHATHHYDTFALPNERIESLRTIHRLSGELLAAAGEAEAPTAQVAVFAEVNQEREQQRTRWSSGEKKPTITRAFLGLWILDLLPKVLDGTLTRIDENAWEIRVTPELFGAPLDPVAHRSAMKQIAAYAFAALEGDVSPQIAPIDATALVRALCQKAISDEDVQDEETDEGPPDFGGNVDDAMAFGETSGNVIGRAALAVEVLALLTPSKPCSKCGEPIPDPHLPGAERCATCGDP